MRVMPKFLQPVTTSYAEIFICWVITHLVSSISYWCVRNLLGVAPELDGILFPDDGRGILDDLDRMHSLAGPICRRASKIVTEKRKKHQLENSAPRRTSNNKIRRGEIIGRQPIYSYAISLSIGLIDQKPALLTGLANTTIFGILNVASLFLPIDIFTVAIFLFGNRHFLNHRRRRHQPRFCSLGNWMVDFQYYCIGYFRCIY